MPRELKPDDLRLVKVEYLDRCSKEHRTLSKHYEALNSRPPKDMMDALRTYVYIQTMEDMLFFANLQEDGPTFMDVKLSRAVRKWADYCNRSSIEQDRYVQGVDIMKDDPQDWVDKDDWDRLHAFTLTAYKELSSPPVV
jgi:hypothetical protein